MDNKTVLRHLYSFGKTFFAVLSFALFLALESGVEVTSRAFWMAVGAGMIRTLYKFVIDDTMKVGDKFYSTDKA